MLKFGFFAEIWLLLLFFLKLGNFCQILTNTYYKRFFIQVIKFYQLKGYFGPQYAAVPPQPQMAHLGLHSGHHLSQHSGGGPESSGISPTSPTPGNTLAVSPIPGRDRVPSPQEIAIHAQQIMQNALIKRKLEEQKENYRRRQEQDQLRKTTDSPSLAFTPTVVMKKMAADRRDSDPKPVIPELKVSTSSDKIAAQSLVGGGLNPMPPRTSPGSPRMGMVHSQQQQQQLLFMQQQIRAQQLAAMQVEFKAVFFAVLLLVTEAIVAANLAFLHEIGLFLLET